MQEGLGVVTVAAVAAPFSISTGGTAMPFTMMTLTGCTYPHAARVFLNPNIQDGTQDEVYANSALTWYEQEQVKYVIRHTGKSEDGWYDIVCPDCVGDK